MQSTAMDERLLTQWRERELREGGSIGKVRIPASLKGLRRVPSDKKSALQPDVFADHLGERLAYARTAARIYESLLAKCHARPEEAATLPIEKLENIRHDKLRHFEMLVNTAKMLGISTSPRSPMANLVGLFVLGIMQVMNDPRTSLAQTLNALLLSELGNSEGWSMLVNITKKFSLEETIAEFEKAQNEELGHLNELRAILASQLLL